jgi:GPH family glycoside/pentoside/hexuronide:cation symporter
MLLVGDTKNNRGLVITLLLCVVAMNAFIYIFAAFKLKDKEELYALGDSSAVPFNPKTLWQDVKGIFKMRAFWTTFFFRATAFAPGGVYFTAFLFYMDYVIKSTGFQATLVDVLPMLVVFAIYPIIGNFVKKKGIKKSILFAMIPNLIGYTILLLTYYLIFALFDYIPIMFTKTLSGTANSIMQAIMIDENEEQTGIRKPGLFGALEAILNAPLAGLQLVLFTTIIELFGYQEGGGIQTASAVLGIRIATAGVPILFCLIGIIPLLLYPYSVQRENELSEYSKQRRRPLEQRDDITIG